MEERVIDETNTTDKPQFISLREILKTEFDPKKLAYFNDIGEYIIQGDLYIEKTQDKDSQAMVRIAVTLPTINSKVPFNGYKVTDHIPEPFLKKEGMQEDYFIPVIFGGFQMIKPKVMLDKSPETNTKLIAYDDTEVHEHVHAADHKRAFNEVIGAWTEKLVKHLQKNYDSDIHDSSDASKIMEKFFKEEGDYAQLIHNYIDKTNAAGKKFHDNEAGREVGYSAASGINERDPSPLYDYVRVNYNDVPWLIKMVEDAEIRRVNVLKFRESQKEMHKLNEELKAKDEDKVFRESYEERSNNQEKYRDINNFLLGGTKIWQKEANFSARGRANFFDVLENGSLKLTKEEKETLISNFEVNETKISELYAGFGTMPNKLSRLKDLINNAEVVRWDLKKEEIIIKEDDKRDSKKHFI